MKEKKGTGFAPVFIVDPGLGSSVGDEDGAAGRGEVESWSEPWQNGAVRVPEAV
jgi:hypothetical protein